MGVVDGNGTFRADDLESLVDLKGSRVRETPDRLEDAGGTALESIHYLPEIGMGVAAVLHGLGVGADGARTAEPEHEVGVVDPVADDRPDLVEHRRTDPRGQVPPRIHRDDLPDATRLDRLLRCGIARIEAANVTGHEKAARRVRRGDDAVAIRHGRGHRLFEKDVFTRLQRGHCGIGVLVPHRRDTDRLDLRIGEHGVEIRVGLFHPELARDLGEAFGIPGADGGDLHIRDRRERLTMLLPEPAEAQNRMLQFFHKDSYLLHFTFLPFTARLRRAHQGGSAIVPPSRTIEVALMYSESSLRRNAAVFAMSMG